MNLTTMDFFCVKTNLIDEIVNSGVNELKENYLLSFFFLSSSSLSSLATSWFCLAGSFFNFLRIDSAISCLIQQNIRFNKSLPLNILNERFFDDFRGNENYLIRLNLLTIRNESVSPI